MYIHQLNQQNVYSYKLIYKLKFVSGEGMMKKYFTMDYTDEPRRNI